MHTRDDVVFQSEDARCAAWLYRPDSVSKPPVIVMAHGLGSVREMRLDAYAERFAEAGYACLVFDYRHFGASDGEPRQLLSIAKEQEDWRSAIRFARELDGVDGTKVVLWGTSFSGGHVLNAAADDRGISAVISQCPFTDGLASSMATHPLTTVKVTALAARDLLGSLMHRSPTMVASAGPPRSAALMATDDSVEGYLGLVPASSTFRNQVAARFAFEITRYFPGRRTGEIACPVMFCICENDSVAPAPATQKHAARAPKGEIKLYDTGHFDIYTDPEFTTVIEDQLAFLNANVPTKRDAT